MTEKLPRPIEPGEIRVGDTVQRTKSRKGIDIRWELTVKEIDGPELLSMEDGRCFTDRTDTWTLLDRPTPAPAVGSRWRDPVTGAEYVRTDGDNLPLFSVYRCGSGDGRGLYGHVGDGCADVISRLTPIPNHGDGCSEWLWDPETDTGWVERLNDRPGAGATHWQIAGDDYRYAYLNPENGDDRDVIARLRPWSERGQR